MAKRKLSNNNSFRFYAGISILLLALLIYALIPKAAPVNSISVSEVQILEQANSSALVQLAVSWDFQTQLTYLAFDIQPSDAPANISREDFSKYHLIRQPQNWINVMTTYDKTSSIEYQAVIDTSEYTELILFVKGANEEGDIASASFPFSLEQKPLIS